MIISAIDSILKEGTRSYFFIQDLPGIKKTFLNCFLYHHYCTYEKIVLYVTSSGIASLLLLGGHILYS